MTAEEIAATKELLESLGCSVVDSERGLITCPGKSLHTAANADADCKLFHNDDGSVRLYCHHKSCLKVIDDTNRRLAAIHKRRNRKRRRKSIPGLEDRERLTKQASCELLNKFAWPYREIIAASDDAINEPVEQHYYQIFGLFDDHDIVWCGRDVWDTGRPGHVWRFRSVREWLAETSCPGQFIAPSTFKPGTYSRAAANVLRRKFLVVESDTLGRDEIGAVFRWLHFAVGLRLRAIIDTAGKSLHAWFDYPDPRVFSGLEQWLPGFGCDPAMFNPAQPCRLPGALRDGDYQKLIFIRW
jgi:hypothetical protein